MLKLLDFDADLVQPLLVLNVLLVKHCVVMLEILILLDLESQVLLLLVNSLILREEVALHIDCLLLEFVDVRLHHAVLLDLLGDCAL
jgi:hypothetical protein